jgi:outer membrane protein
MNVIKTLLLVAVFTLGFTAANAQSKVAHINSEELIASMPAFKALQSKLEKLAKSYNDEVTTSETELKAKYQRYDLEAINQTPETNAAREKEVQLAAQRIEKVKSMAMQDLQKQEQEGMKPIYEVAVKAIEEVAAAQGYEYVLNVNTLVVAKGKDLLPDVKAKLGI